MKKMIYILNHYSSKSTEHFFHVVNLLDEIANNGVEIVLIIEKSDSIPKIKNSNITVVCQKETKKIQRSIELFKLLKKFTNKGFNKIFIRISISSTLIAILVSKLEKAEVFYWQSGTTYEIDKINSGNKLSWFLKKYLPFKLLTNNIDYFVTGPESMANYYNEVVGIKKQKIKILYNDIDINRFNGTTIKEKEELRRSMDIPIDQKIILIVHRLSPVRKTNYYLPYIIDKDIFEKNNAKILVIGDGPEKNELLKNIKEEDKVKFIEFLGSKQNSDIEKYYKIADVFLNPSYTEGFPRVIIEAMATGLPIVSTDAGGTRDLFGKKQLPYIVFKDSRNDLKDTLNMMLNEKIDYSELKNENLESVKRFSTEKVSEMYIKEIFYE